MNWGKGIPQSWNLIKEEMVRVISRGNGMNHFMGTSRSSVRRAKRNKNMNINTAMKRLETSNHKDYVI